MTKAQRVAESEGNPSIIGSIFVTVAAKAETIQTRIMEWVATIVVGRAVIANYEKIHGGCSRPAKWWKIANKKLCFSGHIPQPGGWFWSGRIGPIGYSCGWGDPGQWYFRKKLIFVECDR
jgi:hypothetical protein